MRRVAGTKDQWTDGKDIYVGNPKTGFKLKQETAPVVENREEDNKEDNTNEGDN